MRILLAGHSFVSRNRRYLLSLTNHPHRFRFDFNFNDILGHPREDIFIAGRGGLHCRQMRKVLVLFGMLCIILDLILFC
jgi:hypothetical protein